MRILARGMVWNLQRWRRISFRCSAGFWDGVRTLGLKGTWEFGAQDFRLGAQLLRFRVDDVGFRVRAL